MALTFDTANLVIESDSSITDLVAFHLALRAFEESAGAAVLPVTHTWKALDQGGGAFVYQADLINGWRLSFPTPGNYQIVGNLKGSIVPNAGVYVERTTSVAFVTTAVGASGPTPAQIAEAVRDVLGPDLLRLMDLARLHGLLADQPLVVSATSRTAGPVHQLVSTEGGVTTVTRAP